MNKNYHITILGAGVAGLAVGYYAKRNSVPFTIYEADEQIGGLSRTLEYKGFSFDLGAHRFHDKDSQTTEMVKGLLGDKLKRISVHSSIYHQGRLIDFPFSLLNLIKNIGLIKFGKVLFEILSLRLKRHCDSFEDFALQRYGKTISRLFLLNYSRKLWGVPCSKLSLNVHGKRLQGLNLNSLVCSNFLGINFFSQHYEGPFYYPLNGIGEICNKLEEFCGTENILRENKVTKIIHDHKQIQEIEINGNKKVKIDKLVNTLPLNMFLEVMEPSLPEEILFLGQKLRFRCLILVALFLNRETVFRQGTIYFPSLAFPFTRIHEPKNRSKAMSPDRKTSLVVEVPCQQADQLWNMSNEQLVQLICSKLIEIGWIKNEEIIDSWVERLKYTYPVLEKESEENAQRILAFLNNFNNLKLSGRNGRFKYSGIHDQLNLGRETINSLDEKA
jgi:protoporphyrinogen oxidase